MKALRCTAINLAVIVTVVAAVMAVVFLFFGISPSYEWQQERMVKRVLATDPNQLLSAGRQLLETKRGYVGEISPTSSEVPKSFRKLKPTFITFRTNSVSVDFSDPMNPFGIIVFAEGSQGRGRYRWIDGLWLYDDGQLEKLKQEGVLKNSIELIRSD